jgi:hypothetical protein
VTEVFPDVRKVIYAVAPEETPVFFRRSFEVDAEGKVILSDDREEGRYITQFEPVTAAAGADARSAGGAPTARRESNMTKRERAAAIVASGKTCFKGEQGIALLEKADEDLIKHLEESVTKEPEKEPEPKKEPDKPAEPPKEPEPLNEEKVLAAFPDLKKIVDSHREAETRRKTELVAKLKDAAKASYTEAELQAMPVEQLDKLDKVITAGKAKADFSPLTPRVAEGAEAIPNVPTWEERIKARQAEKTKSA